VLTIETVIVVSPLFCGALTITKEFYIPTPEVFVFTLML
jgi:hypothetical protein